MASGRGASFGTKPSQGVALKTTRTSVTVSGSDLPARMKKGTPDQRQLSISIRQSAERFRLRTARDAVDVEVPAVLPPDVPRRVGFGHRHEHVPLAVVDHVFAASSRRLHGDEAQDLEEVVLHDVAHRADGVVEMAAIGDPEVLSIVICTLETNCRFQTGSRIVFAKRR